MSNIEIESWINKTIKEIKPHYIPDEYLRRSGEKHLVKVTIVFTDGTQVFLKAWERHYLENMTDVTATLEIK